MRGGEADELSGYWVLGRLGGGWSCLTAFKLASPTAHLLMMLCYGVSTRSELLGGHLQLQALKYRVAVAPTFLWPNVCHPNYIVLNCLQVNSADVTAGETKDND